LIGWGVDAADGAQDKLTPETVQMTLNPLKKNEVSATAGQDVGLGAQFSKLDQMYSQKTITKGEYDAARKRLIDEQLPPSQLPVQGRSLPVQASGLPYEQDPNF
jgi:membrane peptidoglycan carboxypeptidase